MDDFEYDSSEWDEGYTCLECGAKLDAYEGECPQCKQKKAEDTLGGLAIIDIFLRLFGF